MDSGFRILKWPAALLLAFLFLSGCSKQPTETVLSLNGMTMGTTYTVKWVSVDDAHTQSAQIQKEITQALVDVNQSMSTYIGDSELSKFNQMPSGAGVIASKPLFFVLALAESISEATLGAFDVTVGPLVNLWGFGPDKRIIKAPSDALVEQRLTEIGYQFLELNPETRQITKTKPLYVDLSAIAKGYGVDVLAAILETHGIVNYLVEIGGELRTSGRKPGNQDWRIAIESPTQGERQVQKIIRISDTGIATSGDYRNYFEEDGIRYSHTIDPKTGRPITHKLASVTVLMPTCAEADALATAFMVMGEEAAYEYASKNQIDAFFIVKSETGFIEKMTPGFEKRLVK